MNYNGFENKETKTLDRSKNIKQCKQRRPQENALKCWYKYVYQSCHILYFSFSSFQFNSLAQIRPIINT